MSILLANLDVSSNGYSCGTVMSAKTYQARSADDFAAIDPGNPYGSSFTNAAVAASQAKAAEQNAACSDAVSSRRTFAALAGIFVFALTFGAVRLLRGS